MKKCRLSVCVMAMLLALSASLPCPAQDATKPKSDAKPAGGDDAQMMAAMMEMGKPSEHHKVLEGIVGSWNYVSKWWTSPEAAPMQFAGTCTTKAVMDGRYFISEVTGKMSMPGPDGKMMDMNFQGVGTEGYDNAKKKYVASWIDNMGTGIMQMEGDYDAAAKTMTYVGEEVPMPGLKMTMRQVVKYTDKDHHTIEFYEVHDGKDVKTMEVAYARS